MAEQENIDGSSEQAVEDLRAYAQWARENVRSWPVWKQSLLAATSTEIEKRAVPDEVRHTAVLSLHPEFGTGG